MPQGWNKPLATVTTRILPPCTSRICGPVSRAGAACWAQTGRASRTVAMTYDTVLTKCCFITPRLGDGANRSTVDHDVPGSTFLVPSSCSLFGFGVHGSGFGVRFVNKSLIYRYYI